MMAAKVLFAITPLLAAQYASAQSGPAVVESVDNTLGGLRFQKASINAAGGQGQMSFAIALPETATGKNDFIGTLTGTGIGWAGVALGVPGMANNLLVVAQPDPASGTIQGTTRMAKYNGYPPEYKQGISLKTIAQKAAPGSWSYTFLCEGCLNSTKFKQNSERAELGWALHPKSNNLSKHPPGAAGSDIVIQLANARSSKYNEIAAGAGRGLPVASAPGPNAGVPGAPAPPLPVAPAPAPAIPVPPPAAVPRPNGAPSPPGPPAAPPPGPAPLGPTPPPPKGAKGYGPPWGGGPPPWAGAQGPPPWITSGGPPPWAGVQGPPPWAGAGGPPRDADGNVLPWSFAPGTFPPTGAGVEVIPSGPKAKGLPPWAGYGGPPFPKGAGGPPFGSPGYGPPTSQDDDDDDGPDFFGIFPFRAWRHRHFY